MRVEPIAPAVQLARTQSSRRGLRRWLRGDRLYAWVVSLILTPICIIWIYPFLWLVSAAFKTNREIFAGLNLIPNTWHWENFSRAWVQANIGTYFVNTVIITLTTVTIVVVTTSMMGYVIGRFGFPGKRIILALFLATIFVPEGYTIIPLFDIVNRLGLNNSLLGVILAESGAVHIIFILLFAGYFAQLPRELEEAAIVDGAGFNRIFLQIMLPLAQPVMATTVILQFMASWNSFFLPLVLTLSRPELRTLGVGMFAFQGEYFSDWSGMAAAATISLFPIILVFLLLQRYFVEGLAGAIKQ